MVWSWSRVCFSTRAVTADWKFQRPFPFSASMCAKAHPTKAIPVEERLAVRLGWYEQAQRVEWRRGELKPELKILSQTIPMAALRCLAKASPFPAIA
jgi:hypothetical protein